VRFANRRRVARILLIASLLIAGPLRAQEDAGTELARRHYLAGAAAYDAGLYERAASEFEEARREKALPALDFNLARTYERMERLDEAIAAYRRYLAQAPPPTDAEEIRAHVATLEQRRSPPTTPPAKKPPHHRRWWLWPTLAAGAVVIVVGVGLGIGLAQRDPNLPSTTDGNVAVHFH
jgi:tetratricopeptide (TPR) repeat protein